MSDGIRQQDSETQCRREKQLCPRQRAIEGFALRLKLSHSHIYHPVKRRRLPAFQRTAAIYLAEVYLHAEQERHDELWK